MHRIDGDWRTGSRGMTNQSTIYECGGAYIFLTWPSHAGPASESVK